MTQEEPLKTSINKNGKKGLLTYTRNKVYLQNRCDMFNVQFREIKLLKILLSFALRY
jgi:hypothetical protein